MAACCRCAIDSLHSSCKEGRVSSLWASHVVSRLHMLPASSPTVWKTTAYPLYFSALTRYRMLESLLLNSGVPCAPPCILVSMHSFMFVLQRESRLHLWLRTYGTVLRALAVHCIVFVAIYRRSHAEISLESLCAHVAVWCATLLLAQKP